MDEDGLIDLEISLVKAFNWSLHDIDETDIESLLPFVFRMTGTGQNNRVYADQVDWL
jgi:hypothetical protein